MQAADIIKYIEDPQLLNEQSVSQLQKLVSDFPYFQPAHLLLSMAAKKWDASVYQQTLKKTAIVAPNRAHLFELIHNLDVAAERRPVATPAAETEAGQKEKEQPAPATQQEETKHELDILKAAELTAETNVQTPETAVEEKQTAPEEQLEKEIEKSVVNSFVEKEILKTPELHKPQTRPEPESFVEWLALLKKNNGQPNQDLGEKPKTRLRPETKKTEKTEKPVEKTENSETGTPDLRKEKQKAIIDKIIENNPGIIRSKEDQKFFNAEIKARESLLESEHLVTETLARIYALQGSVNKAVRAYEILSLKFPQKSAYFATLIQKLKNNQ